MYQWYQCPYFLCYRRDWAQITKFMGPSWGPPGSCRPQMGPMLTPWTLLSNYNLAFDFLLSESLPMCLDICEHCRFRIKITISYNIVSHHADFTGAGARDSWWRHQMETFSALLAICAGNSPVTAEFIAQRLVTRSFDVFFDLRLNKRLSKQSWGWWFETPSHPLWRHCMLRNGCVCEKSALNWGQIEYDI